MNDEVTAPSAESAPVVVEQTLDDLYRETGVTEATPQTKADQLPIAPVVASVGDIPDPYDEAFKPSLQSKLQSQQDRMAVIEAHQQTQLRETARAQQAEAEAKLVEDIKTASSYVMENAGLKDLPLSDEAQLALANQELNAKAASDPKFQMLWQNRDKNPDAWNKALAIQTKEIAKKFEAKVDPKLSADRKALRATQQSSATTEQESQGSNPLEGLEGVEFDRAWRAIARGRNN